MSLIYYAYQFPLVQDSGFVDRKLTLLDLNIQLTLMSIIFPNLYTIWLT